MMNRPRRPPAVLGAAVLAALSLLAAACTGSSGDVESVITTTTSTAPPSTDATTTTTTAAPTGPTPPESMPGDIIEFGPTEGDQLAVVGVAHDDTLNVRIAPGIEFDVVNTLAPDATDVIANGENRLLESSFWIEIANGSGVGWVNEAFIGFLGVSRETDSGVSAATDDAAELGRLVAETFASQEVRSSITLQRDDGDTVVYDVLGLADDAAKGFRITVETELTGGTRQVASVTEQTICSRGVTPELLCV